MTKNGLTSTTRSFFSNSENETSFRITGAGGEGTPLFMAIDWHLLKSVMSRLMFSLSPSKRKVADDESDSENVFPAKNSPCSSFAPS
ncbi:hypothetical protein JTE90_020264 [Oedothorax gibbosus]|uniref:Uncharacterized protein n=1 Tax=Oedothorax gibbosus TaxID=931172 RepID=A0AAV6VMV9_9ARAC|nr:hypothetical protein JTE90_020264 [Oedothorax gibbosus]